MKESAKFQRKTLKAINVGNIECACSIGPNYSIMHVSIVQVKLNLSQSSWLLSSSSVCQVLQCNN